MPLVRADPLSADAWWLLANAVENRDQKLRALDRVLKLRPGDEAAQKMLDRLGGQPPPAQTPPAKRTATVARAPAQEEFTDFEAEPTDRVRVRRPRRNPLTIILALIGLLTVLSCGVCIAVTAVSIPTIRVAVQQVVLTMTYVPSLGLLSNIATPDASATPVMLPSDLQIQGSVEVGQVIQNSVSTFHGDGWTFNATANQHIVIEVDAFDPKLDPHLYLYDPSGLQIAENDDIDGSGNRNSRIEITLPSAGKYTIRISAFADGGAYKLTLTEGT